MHKKLSLFAITCACSTVLCMEKQPSYRVILDTDLQYGNTTQEERKIGHAECIKHVIKNTPSLQESCVVVAGDMIEGQLPLGECSRCFPCLRWCSQPSKDQLKLFKTRFLQPLEALPNTTVIETAGNHEFYDPSGATLDLINSRHGGLRYTTQLGPLLIIVGAVYFDEAQRNWLQQKLENVPKEKPTILVNHYNAVGDHDAWYPPEDDMQLASVLEGRNVMRLWGHNHSTYKATWKEHPVYCGGGKEFITLNFDEQGALIDDSAYVAEKQANGSYSPSKRGAPEWTPQSNEDDKLGEKIQRTYNGWVINQHLYDTTAD